jgi:hypothetical protein
MSRSPYPAVHTDKPTVADSLQIDRLARHVRWLRLYAVGSMFVLLLLAVSAFTHSTDPRGRFSEIDVGRINVVDSAGRYAVVISNADRMPGNVMNGRERHAGRRGAGLLFYNADGNEAGGLIFDSARSDTSVSAFGQLSLDRFESDQVAAIRYVESADYWDAGLQVSHFPRHNLVEWHFALDSIDLLPTEAARDSARRELRRRFFREGKWEIPRLFAGERGQTALLELRDMQGRERIRMTVDSAGTARLEFLDESGTVTHRVPGP